MTPPTTRRRALGTATLGLMLALALGVGSLAGPAGADTASSGPTGAATSEEEGTRSTLDPPPTACPAPEGNARFVRFIYLNILYRCPDEGGLAYWTAKLDSGSLTRGQFAKHVDLSTENLVFNNVDALYQRLLGRAPSSSELSAGVAYIKANQSDGQLIADLLASDEYYAAFGAESRATEKDEAWLDAMYQFILDRPVDEDALAFWSDRLGDQSTQASRQRVTRFLERAPEATIGWIYGVYGAGLNRAPSEGDLGYWQQWLLGPQGKWRTFHMWTTVLSSPEGYARAQTQPSPEMLSSSPEGIVEKSDVAG